MNVAGTQVRPARPVVRFSLVRAAAACGALLVSSLLVGALLGEFIIRVVVPQQLIVARPEVYRPDADLGWRHRENVKTLMNTGGGAVHFRTDSNGYRIPWNDGPHVGPGQELRILALGDSFLEAIAVEAESTIPSLLEERLAVSLNRPVAVDNAGVAGWDPNQYRIEARRALERTRYDLGLVFLYVGNDIVRTAVDAYPPPQTVRAHRFRWPGSWAWREWVKSVFSPINGRLETRSHLFLFLKGRLEVPLARLGLTTNYFPEVFRLDERTSEGWDTTTAICQSIQGEFSAHGAPVIFTLLPTPYQVDREVFDTYVRSFRIRLESVDLEQPNKELAKRFRGASLTLLDPLEELRQRSKQGARLYGTVDRHLNANGHQAVTAIVLPAVEAVLGRLDPGRGGSALMDSPIAAARSAGH
jgi:hypothetical protein